MTQNDTIRLELTLEEAQTVIDALQPMPWTRVANLIPKIMHQANQSTMQPEAPDGLTEIGQHIPAKQDTRDGGRSGKIEAEGASEGVTDGE